MLDAGLKHQEAVAILSPNHGHVVTAMLGLWRAGGVWIPVNTRTALADNIAYLNYVRAGISWSAVRQVYRPFLKRPHSPQPQLGSYSPR